MVLDQVRALKVEVLLQTRVEELITLKARDTEILTGLRLEGGETYMCEMVVFAIGITPRDELATASGIATHPRGGILVEDNLQTSAPAVYAIGECASWKGETYGLIAPGIEMAEILAFNLTEGPAHKMRAMAPPDLSTKLKLMGVNVASFGDYLADRKPPSSVALPRRRKEPAKVWTITPGVLPGDGSNAAQEPNSGVRALCYHDPFSSVYKKYLFSTDGKYLLGGMMIGDVADYTKLVTMVKKRVSHTSVLLSTVLLTCSPETSGDTARSTDSWCPTEGRRIRWR